MGQTAKPHRGSVPNWFIAWPFGAPVALPEAPKKVRVFAPADRHVTSVFLGPVGETVARRAWDLVAALPSVPVWASLGELRMLGGGRPSAMSAIVSEGAAVLAERMTAHAEVLAEAGLIHRDVRPPLPHVTVARIQRSANDDARTLAIEWAEGLRIEARARIDRLALYTWSADRSRQLFEIRAERIDPPSP